MDMLLTIPFHLVILYQDLRERRISLIILIALFICAIGIITFSEFKITPWKDILFNEIMLFSQVICMILFIKLAKGKSTQVVDHYLGLGDIILLSICGFCFSAEDFFIFYLASLVIGVLLFVMFGFIMKKRMHDLPFAAVLSAVFIFFAVAGFCGSGFIKPFSF